MAKQDVLNAINSTIAENNEKGITANSLRNVLTMMAENAGEGGGSSSGGEDVIRVETLGDGMVFIMMFIMEMVAEIAPIPELESFFQTGVFDSATWENLRIIFSEEDFPGLYDAMTPYVVNAFEKNRLAFQKIREKELASEGVFCLLDASQITSVFQLLDYGEIIPGSISYLASVESSSINYGSEFILHPVKYIKDDVDLFSEFLYPIKLRSDGSWIYNFPQGDDKKTEFVVNIPNQGIELNENNVTENKSLIAAREYIDGIDIKDIQVRYIKNQYNSYNKYEKIPLIHLLLHEDVDNDGVWVAHGVFYRTGKLHKFVMNDVDGIPVVSEVTLS